MKTRQQITVQFGADRPVMGGSVHNITIPAGTRCKPTGDGQFWVDDLSFLPRNSMVLHDATHYGIRLNPNQVTN